MLTTARALALLAFAPAAAAAQTPPADPDIPASPGQSTEEEIVITAPTLRGDVIGGGVPDIRLDPAEIATYAADDIAELLTALQPQTGENAVVLVNGRRISGRNEINRLPPEAIERVDILPPEVALAYGFRADQRVVNIVLRSRFAAMTASVEAGFATDGGRTDQEIEFSLSRIRGDERLSLEIEYERADALFQAERGLSGLIRLFDPAGNVAGLGPGGEIDPTLSALVGAPVTVAGVPLSSAAGPPLLSDFVATADRPNAEGDGDYRTLLPASRSLAIGGTFARPIFGDINATLNARYSTQSATSAFGLPTSLLTVPTENPFSPFGQDVALYRAIDTFGALVGTNETSVGRLQLGLNGRLGGWTWQFNTSHERSAAVRRNDSDVDDSALAGRIAAGDTATNPFGPDDPALLTWRRPDTIRTKASNTVADMVATGTLVRLPAGNATATLSAGFAIRASESRGTRAGVPQDTSLSAESTQLRASLSLPLASRRRAVLAWLGDLSVNLSAGRQQLSGIGDATTMDVGTIWSPVEPLRLSANFARNEGLPPIAQRANPIVETPNVLVLDFASGETVSVTRLEGGNPALLADSRDVLTLTGQLRPLPRTNLLLNVNYTRTTVRNLVGALPAATPEVEAAFPDRFVRGANGRLVRLDVRPVNFARAEQEQLEWGLFASLPFGPQGATALSGRPGFGQGPRLPGLRPRPGPGGPDGPAADGRGRVLLALNHTWRLRDRLTISDGLAPLNLLAGDAFAERGRGRHQVTARANLVRGGLGVSLDATWQSGSRLRGGATDLRFSSLGTINLRLFADLGERPALVRAAPWLDGTRVSLRIGNLFNARQRVIDATGDTPEGFEGPYLDPLGRTLGFTLRKQF